jgi:glycosidase
MRHRFTRREILTAGLGLGALLLPLVFHAAPAEAGGDRPLVLPADTPLGPAWANGRTLYQLNLHNYTPEGTIAAGAKHLPRLAELGVGILWLMPVHPRGQGIPPKNVLKEYKGSPFPLPELKPFEGNPFCPRDHRQVDPLLGTKDDLKTFTDQAHELGMKVILGWVPNHTSWDAPLLQAHPDWYMHGKRGQIMQHGPWAPIARLDYRNNQALWDYMLAARRSFVEECGIDGFREDVAGATPVEHWKWLRNELDPERKLLFLAEAHEEKLLGPLDMLYDWEMPTVYWRFLKGGEPLEVLDELLAKQHAASPAWARRLRYLFNHDQTGARRSHWQGRHVIENLYGAMDGPEVPTHREKLGDALKAMALLNFSLPGGRPLIFMGEEIGYYGRVSHYRKSGCPFPWTEMPDRALAPFYSKLTALFRDNPALQRGSFERIETAPGSRIYAFSRSLPDGNRVVVAVNLSDKEQAIGFGPHMQGLRREHFTGTPAEETTTLPPWGYVAFTP